MKILRKFWELFGLTIWFLLFLIALGSVSYWMQKHPLSKQEMQNLTTLEEIMGSE